MFSLVEEIADRKEVSLCALTEPNKAEANRHKHDWYTEESLDTAITINNNHNRLRITGSGTGPSFVWVEVENVGRIYSCYSSPNGTLEDLQQLLDNLTDSTRNSTSPFTIITGDFNAKAPLWGSHTTNKRGSTVLDWMAANDYVVINDGVEPTFHGAQGSSFPDLTLCTARQAHRISE